MHDLSVGLTAVNGATVLLAVEIADSSLGYDLGRKPAIYAEFGVRELWVVHAAARNVHVFRGTGSSGYSDHTVLGSADRVVPLVAPQAFAISLDTLPRV